eukprot:9889489-Alexandrium_andersonii.AAC.1
MFGVACSSNIGRCNIAPGVRILNCAGPGWRRHRSPKVPRDRRSGPAGAPEALPRNCFHGQLRNFD